MDSGTVIAAATLTHEFLKNLLDSIASVNRKIAIGIGNGTPYRWQALNTYFYHGTSDVILPEYVKEGKAGLYTARKALGPVARGVVGVFTYYMEGADKTVAVMFSVPFNYNLYSNRWDVSIYRGKKRASREMYESMYYHSNPFEGDDGWHTKPADGFQIKGVMTSGGECVLELRITKWTLHTFSLVHCYSAITPWKYDSLLVVCITAFC